MQALDVTDGPAVQALIARWRPSVVFLCGALTAVDYCEDHEDEARLVNLQGPRAVALAARQVGSTLVHYSTEYVFDGRDGPYGEDDPICPQGIYARSKAEGEQAVRDALADHLIVRTTVVFDWDRASRNFAMQVWARLSAGEPMRVPSDQVGNPTLARYLAETSVELVQRQARGTVNVVGRDRVPRTELGTRLAVCLGLNADLIQPVATVDLNQRAPRPLSAGLRTEKLAMMLGRPIMSLDQALDRFLAAKLADVG
jgi:dTDP-4-dehydrorhamnose reductase